MSDDDTNDPGHGLAVRLEFLNAYRADRESGAPRTLDDYLARWPDFADVVRDEHARLERGIPGTGDGPEHIGPYEVVREIARGGQGVVYEGHDPVLGRQVAIKALRVGPLFGKEQLARFRREAQLLSRLDARGVCPVFGTGEEHGVAWIAMRFVEGETIAALVQRRRASGGHGDWREAATLVRSVLLTLASAHELGIVHRDLKPSNVMLSADGPVLLDFGLARSEDAAHALTLSDSQLGTPTYMAPEQVRGEAADARSDIHAAAVLLWELLCLEPPFQGPGRERLFQAILTETPHLPPHVARAIPKQLSSVLEFALQKEPARRYQTAAEFAAELDRVLRGEPVRARRAPALVRLALWARREPRLARSLAATVVLICIAFAITIFLISVISDEQKHTEAALRRARAEGIAALSLQQLHEDQVLALALAERAFELDPTPSTRTALRQCLQDTRVLWERGHRTREIVTACPIDEHLVVAFEDGSLDVFSAEDGKRIAFWDAETIPPQHLKTLRSDLGGARLALGRRDGSLILLNHELEPLHRIQLRGSIHDLVEHGDSLWVPGFGGGLFRVRIEDPLRSELASPIPGLLALRASRDGHLLGAGIRSIHFFDPEGALLRSWRHGGFRGIAVLPDGRLVSTPHVVRPESSSSLNLRFEGPDGESFEEEQALPAQAMELGPEGKQLLVASHQDVVLLDLETRRRRDLLRQGGITRFLSSSKSHYLVGTEDSSIRIFDREANERGSIHGHRGLLEAMHFTSNGDWIYSADHSGLVRRSRTRGACDLELGSGGGGAAFDPEGRFVAVAGPERIRVLRIPDLHPMHEFDVDARVIRIRVSTRGSRLLLCRENGRTSLHELDGTLLAHSPQYAANSAGDFADETGTLVAQKVAGGAIVWNEKGETVAQLPAVPVIAHRQSIAPTALRIATADLTRQVRLWNTKGEVLARVQREDDHPTAIDLHPSGSQLAVGGTSGMLRLYDDEGNELAAWRAHRSPIWEVAFVGHDRQSFLVSAGDDGVAACWDLEGTPISMSRRHDSAVRQVRFSSSGHHALTLDSSGVARLWHGRFRHKLCRLPLMSSRIRTVRFAPKGDAILAVSRAGRICLWPVSDDALRGHVSRWSVRGPSQYGRDRLSELLDVYRVVNLRR